MQEIFWIIAGLEGFLFMKKRRYSNNLFVINAFHDIECNFVSKKKLKVLHTLALRFFVYLLPSLTNEWPSATL